jgi:hypothetical protein
VSDDSKLESISKFLTGTGVAAGATLFISTGFLAVRAYLNALGIPEHAGLSVNDYLQYGGRIVFVLALQLAPIMALVLLAFDLPFRNAETIQSRAQNSTLCC